MTPVSHNSFLHFPIRLFTISKRLSPLAEFVKEAATIRKEVTPEEIREITALSSAYFGETISEDRISRIVREILSPFGFHGYFSAEELAIIKKLHTLHFSAEEISKELVDISNQMPRGARFYPSRDFFRPPHVIKAIINKIDPIEICRFEGILPRATFESIFSGPLSVLTGFTLEIRREKGRAFFNPSFRDHRFLHYKSSERVARNMHCSIIREWVFSLFDRGIVTIPEMAEDLAFIVRLVDRNLGLKVTPLQLDRIIGIKASASFTLFPMSVEEIIRVAELVLADETITSDVISELLFRESEEANSGFHFYPRHRRRDPLEFESLRKTTLFSVTNCEECIHMWEEFQKKRKETFAEFFRDSDEEDSTPPVHSFFIEEGSREGDLEKP